MVDRDLILKKLAFIEGCVRELRTIARLEVIESAARDSRIPALWSRIEG